MLCGNEVFSGTDVLKSSNECGYKLFSSNVWRGTKIAGNATKREYNYFFNTMHVKNIPGLSILV